MRLIIVLLLFLLPIDLFSLKNYKQNESLIFGLTNLTNILERGFIYEDNSLKMQDYLSFYQLPTQFAYYHAGFFTNESKKLFYQIMEPINPKGTVLFVHGYLSHSGDASPLIKGLYKLGYRVCLYDYEGHGLSDGKRADIDDFNTYSETLKKYIDYLRMNYQGHFFYIGHSTGCAIGLNYLYQNENPFDHIIFLAPLLRSYLWDLSMVGLNLLWFVDTLPRYFRLSSHDKEYMEFSINQDPLQPRIVSMNWVRALRKWNYEISQKDSFVLPLTVIQGSADTVVEWKFNTDFLKSRHQAEIYLIDGAYHSLPYESDEFMIHVLNKIDEKLQSVDKEIQ